MGGARHLELHSMQARVTVHKIRGAVGTVRGLWQLQELQAQGSM